jgi:hypothetical protein
MYQDIVAQRNVGHEGRFNGKIEEDLSQLTS